MFNENKDNEIRSLVYYNMALRKQNMKLSKENKLLKEKIEELYKLCESPRVNLSIKSNKRLADNIRKRWEENYLN